MDYIFRSREFDHFTSHQSLDRGIKKISVEASYRHHKEVPTILPLFINGGNFLLSRRSPKFSQEARHSGLFSPGCSPLFAGCPDPVWSDELFFWNCSPFHLGRSIPKVSLYIYFRISILELRFGECKSVRFNLKSCQQGF